MKRPAEALFDAEITLAAYHLALDAHPEVGNNALLASELGVAVDASSSPTSASAARLAQPATELLTRGSGSGSTRCARLSATGPTRSGRVAIVSGGGARATSRRPPRPGLRPLPDRRARRAEPDDLARSSAITLRRRRPLRDGEARRPGAHARGSPNDSAWTGSSSSCRTRLSDVGAPRGVFSDRCIVSEERDL